MPCTIAAECISSEIVKTPILKTKVKAKPRPILKPKTIEEATTELKTIFGKFFPQQ